MVMPYDELVYSIIVQFHDPLHLPSFYDDEAVATLSAVCIPVLYPSSFSLDDSLRYLRHYEGVARGWSMLCKRPCSFIQLKTVKHFTRFEEKVVKGFCLFEGKVN